MISKEKAISTLILIFITAALFFILVNFFSCACCFADDNWSAILPEFCQADPLSCGYFKNFFYESYPSGLFISTFLNRLFGVFLPLWLNLHPSDFKMYYFCYIAPLFIFSFIFILNSLLIKKINYFYPVCFLFTTSLLFMIFQHPVGALYLYDGLFRMIMPCFLFAGLFCLLLKNTDNYTLKNYIPVFIMTFLCCISNELISVTTIFGFLLYAVLSINLNQKKKVHTYLLFCIFLSFLGLLILYKTGTFYRKSENVIFNLQYFVEVLRLIPDYTGYYIKYVFKNHTIGYLILILQLLTLYPKYSKDENIIKTIKLIISFLSGVLIFFFLLIGLKNTYYVQGSYWVIHQDLHEMFNIILCIFNFALLNISITKGIIKKYAIGTVFILFSIIFSISNFYYYKDITHDYQTAKKEIYKAEKIIRLANLKNKTAYLDKKLLLKWLYMGYFCKSENEYTLYSYSPFKEYINQFEKEEKITNQFMFTDTEIVYKEFKNNGGNFTKEELEDIHFTKLRDKKFLLNN